MPQRRPTTWAFVVAGLLWAVVFYLWFLAPSEPIDQYNYLGRGIAAIAQIFMWTLGAGATLVVLLILRNIPGRRW